MLTQPTLEKLCAMRLHGMAEAFREQQEDADDPAAELRGAARPADRPPVELARRTGRWNGVCATRRLQGPACVEDIDFRTARGLDRQLVRSLDGRVGLGARAPEPVPARAHRHRQELAGARLRAEGLPRRLHGATSPRPRNCSAIWRWRGPTAACASCCTA